MLTNFSKACHTAQLNNQLPIGVLSVLLPSLMVGQTN